MELKLCQENPQADMRGSYSALPDPYSCWGGAECPCQKKLTPNIGLLGLSLPYSVWLSSQNSRSSSYCQAHTRWVYWFQSIIWSKYFVAYWLRDLFRNVDVQNTDGFIKETHLFLCSKIMFYRSSFALLLCSRPYSVGAQIHWWPLSGCLSVYLSVCPVPVENGRL